MIVKFKLSLLPLRFFYSNQSWLGSVDKLSRVP